MTKIKHSQQRTETPLEEKSEIKNNNHNTSLSSTTVRPLGLLQPSRYNISQEIKYLEEGKSLD